MHEIRPDALGQLQAELRHTYASLLLAAGVSPAYVQEQLGHASIELTVGTYGRWLRKKAPEALEILDGGKVVAETPETVAAGLSGGAGRSPQVGIGPSRKVARQTRFDP